MQTDITNTAGAAQRQSLRLPEEYTGTSVPDAHTVSGVRIGFVIIGMGINFTAFALSADAVLRAGFRRGIAACFLAGLVLAIGGALTGYVGAKLRLSAFVILRTTFGRTGSGLVNVLLMLLAFGFFCVLSSMLGAALGGILTEMGLTLPVWVCSLTGAMLVAAATLWGFAALQKITFLLLPLLFLGMLYMAIVGVHRAGPATIVGYPGQGQSFGMVTSAVVGGLIGFVVVFPNLTRYARTPRDGVIAGILGMGIGLPSILLLAALSVVATGHKDVVAILTGLGFGAFALFLAATSIWKTNVLNLYTTYLGVATLWPSIPRTASVIGAGLAGGLLGAIEVERYFLPFLLFLSVATPPIAAIYTIDSLARPARTIGASSDGLPAFEWPALLTWAVAAAVGGLSLAGVVSFTSVPSVDAAVVAAALFGIVAVVRARS